MIYVVFNSGKEKFMTGDEPLAIVLNSDGVEIDEDYFLLLAGNTELMLLQGDERWVPQYVPHGNLFASQVL